jgi:hypothetical protein
MMRLLAVSAGQCDCSVARQIDRQAISLITASCFAQGTLDTLLFDSGAGMAGMAAAGVAAMAAAAHQRCSGDGSASFATSALPSGATPPQTAAKHALTVFDGCRGSTSVVAQPLQADLRSSLADLGEPLQLLDDLDSAALLQQPCPAFQPVAATQGPAPMSLGAERGRSRGALGEGGGGSAPAGLHGEGHLPEIAGETACGDSGASKGSDTEGGCRLGQGGPMNAVPGLSILDAFILQQQQKAAADKKGSA